MELYFVLSKTEFGKTTEEELVPGGIGERVTNENLMAYIHLVSHHRLNFQKLISGPDGSLNIDDLRNNTEYGQGYNAEHDVIKMFWDVMESFSTENQKLLLKFVMSCSRGPLLGFKYLEPRFCIQRDSTGSSDSLPTAATCFNTLRLPPYQRKEQLEEKLIYAIRAEAGFDLA